MAAAIAPRGTEQEASVLRKGFGILAVPRYSVNCQSLFLLLSCRLFSVRNRRQAGKGRRFFPSVFMGICGLPDDLHSGKRFSVGRQTVFGGGSVGFRQGYIQGSGFRGFRKMSGLCFTE